MVGTLGQAACGCAPVTAMGISPLPSIWPIAVGDDLRDVLVGRAGDVDVGALLEQFRRHLRGRAVVAEEDLAGMLLGVVHQRGQRAVGAAGRHDADGAERAQHADLLEVLLRVVGQALVQELVGGVRGVRGQEEGVAVRRRGLGRLGADAAAGAGAVFDDHGLPGLFAQVLGERTRGQVGCAAGRGRHDDRHGLFGPACGVGRCGQDKAGAEQRRAKKTGNGHACLLIALGRVLARRTSRGATPGWRRR
ncbi:hypothetical protein G6F68_012596 [Rhizopus microsporus]|nr:hypothetical protein G6F68_012596 [Rhizopus microsporus]